MDYENVLGERKFPTYEQLKTGLLRLIDEGKISREDASRLLPELRESEDEMIRTSLYTFFKGMLEGNEDCYKVGGFVKFEGIDVKSILAWLEKQKEQKPAEWSEEDERIRLGLIEMYKNEHLVSVPIGIRTKDIIRFLENLRPEPKQELSNEDENKIERLAFLVSVAAEKEMISPEECIDLRRFVKSYRPSWKPTEEQMYALKVALETFRVRNSDNISAGNDKVFTQIESLYEDLQKIR